MSELNLSSVIKAGAILGTLDIVTAGGIAIHRSEVQADYDNAISPLVDALDSRVGLLLSSSYEFPDRYKRWDMGFVDPLLSVTSRGLMVEIKALNARGRVLLPVLKRTLDALDAVRDVTADGDVLAATVRPAERRFAEEERSRQPSVFSVLRALIALFRSDEDSHIGLYGAFGYDLAFQFEPVEMTQLRGDDQRDLVLFLPDQIMVRDHQRQEARLLTYEFEVDGASTEGIARSQAEVPFQSAPAPARACDHEPGEYAALVDHAKESFKRGDLFEVVPGQTFFEACPAPPSEIFRRLRERNPAPYGFLINLGDGEYLVGASPEMYVRVSGRRVETCPISGTIKRGADAIGDAEQIRTLLNSAKDESELTMCTDVDRNDKSRICEPGSVRVIGRRQIEMYSRLIHTVDHVEGTLRPEFDALDAFLSHTWAVTVTGAPKLWAMRFLEANEKSPRRWYGGAVGKLGFDGNMSTGLTLRTVRIKDGVAEVRAGATLLYDSDPIAEEAETRLKASAMIDAIRRPRGTARPGAEARILPRVGVGLKVVLVDHQDSFVHTLANYVRQTGAEVVTWRAGFDAADLAAAKPDMVMLSPGPGRPEDFGLARTIAMADDLGLPLFGVCLGLQGMGEYLGGRLGQLDVPQHGKPARITVTGGRLFEGLPAQFTVGRYHSLHVAADSLPPDVAVTALTDDGIVMAIEHKTKPWAAVQFHPESIMTMDHQAGLTMIHTALAMLCRR
ncbi:MAG: anthranilate synthase component I [Rhodospirillaceae bacterium]